jgi:hypothetical protein
MASKSLKSNKARIAKQRRRAKAAGVRNPWPIAGIAFCLGAIVTVVVFVWTPLGALCIASDKTPATSVSKDPDKPATPNATEANKLAAGPIVKPGDRKKRPAIPEPGDPAGAGNGKNDPLAELQRVREINERNRKLMEAAAARRGRPQPSNPLVPKPPKPIIPGHNPSLPKQPIIPGRVPTPTPPR